MSAPAIGVNVPWASGLLMRSGIVATCFYHKPSAEIVAFLGGELVATQKLDKHECGVVVHILISAASGVICATTAKGRVFFVAFGRLTESATGSIADVSASSLELTFPREGKVKVVSCENVLEHEDALLCRTSDGLFMCRGCKYVPSKAANGTLMCRIIWSVEGHFDRFRACAEKHHVAAVSGTTLFVFFRRSSSDEAVAGHYFPAHVIRYGPVKKNSTVYSLVSGAREETDPIPEGPQRVAWKQMEYCHVLCVFLRERLHLYTVANSETSDRPQLLLSKSVNLHHGTIFKMLPAYRPPDFHCYPFDNKMGIVALDPHMALSSDRANLEQTFLTKSPAKKMIGTTGEFDILDSPTEASIGSPDLKGGNNGVALTNFCFSRFAAPVADRGYRLSFTASVEFMHLMRTLVAAAGGTSETNVLVDDMCALPVPPQSANRQTLLAGGSSAAATAFFAPAATAPNAAVVDLVMRIKAMGNSKSAVMLLLCRCNFLESTFEVVHVFSHPAAFNAKRVPKPISEIQLMRTPLASSLDPGFMDPHSIDLGITPLCLSGGSGRDENARSSFRSLRLTAVAHHKNLPLASTLSSNVLTIYHTQTGGAGWTILTMRPIDDFLVANITAKSEWDMHESPSASKPVPMKRLSSFVHLKLLMTNLTVKVIGTTSGWGQGDEQIVAAAKIRIEMAPALEDLVRLVPHDITSETMARSAEAAWPKEEEIGTLSKFESTYLPSISRCFHLEPIQFDDRATQSVVSTFPSLQRGTFHAVEDHYVLDGWAQEVGDRTHTASGTRDTDGLIVDVVVAPSSHEVFFLVFKPSLQVVVPHIATLVKSGAIAFDEAESTCNYAFPPIPVTGLPSGSSIFFGGTTQSAFLATLIDKGICFSMSIGNNQVALYSLSVEYSADTRQLELKFVHVASLRVPVTSSVAISKGHFVAGSAFVISAGGQLFKLKKRRSEKPKFPNQELLLTSSSSDDEIGNDDGEEDPEEDSDFERLELDEDDQQQELAVVVKDSQWQMTKLCLPSTSLSLRDTFIYEGTAIADTSKCFGLCATGTILSFHMNVLARSGGTSRVRAFHPQFLQMLFAQQKMVAVDNVLLFLHASITSALRTRQEAYGETQSLGNMSFSHIVEQASFRNETEAINLIAIPPVPVALFMKPRPEANEQTLVTSLSKLRELLLEVQLEGLSGKEQLVLTAIVDVIARHRATGSALDNAGKRFQLEYNIKRVSQRMIGVHSHRHHEQDSDQTSLVMSNRSYCWAAISLAQQELLSSICHLLAPSSAASSSSQQDSGAKREGRDEKLSWELISYIGLPLWLSSIAQLKAIAENLAKAHFQKTKDVKSWTALLYCLLFNSATKIDLQGGRKYMAVLSQLCHLCNEPRLRQFFLRDFLTLDSKTGKNKNKEAARANGYAALGKGNVLYAVAFFLLAGEVETAAKLFLQRPLSPDSPNTRQWLLSLFILRIALNDDTQAIKAFWAEVDPRFLVAPNFHQPDDPNDNFLMMEPPIDQWCRCALQWRCGNRVTALQQLLSLDEEKGRASDVADVVPFVVNAISADPVLHQMNKDAGGTAILPLAQKWSLRWKTVQHHLRQKMVYFACEELGELLQDIKEFKQLMQERQSQEEEKAISLSTTAEAAAPIKKTDFNTGTLAFFGVDDDDDEFGFGAAAAVPSAAQQPIASVAARGCHVDSVEEEKIFGANLRQVAALESLSTALLALCVKRMMYFRSVLLFSQEQHHQCEQLLSCADEKLSIPQSDVQQTIFNDAEALITLFPASNYRLSKLTADVLAHDSSNADVKLLLSLQKSLPGGPAVREAQILAKLNSGLHRTLLACGCHLAGCKHGSRNEVEKALFILLKVVEKCSFTKSVELTAFATATVFWAAAVLLASDKGRKVQHKRHALLGLGLPLLEAYSTEPLSVPISDYLAHYVMSIRRVGEANSPVSAAPFAEYTAEQKALQDTEHSWVFLNCCSREIREAIALRRLPAHRFTNQLLLQACVAHSQARAQLFAWSTPIDVHRATFYQKTANLFRAMRCEIPEGQQRDIYGAIRQSAADLLLFSQERVSLESMYYSPKAALEYKEKRKEDKAKGGSIEEQEETNDAMAIGREELFLSLSNERYTPRDHRQHLISRSFATGTALQDRCKVFAPSTDRKMRKSDIPVVFSLCLDQSTFDSVAAATLSGILSIYGVRDKLMAAIEEDHPTSTGIHSTAKKRDTFFSLFSSKSAAAASSAALFLERTLHDRNFATVAFATSAFLTTDHQLNNTSADNILYSSFPDDREIHPSSPVFSPRQQRPMSQFGAKVLTSHPHLPLFLSAGIDGCVTLHQFGKSDALCAYRSSAYRGVATCIVFSPNGYNFTVGDNTGCLSVFPSLPSEEAEVKYAQEHGPKRVQNLQSICEDKQVFQTVKDATYLQGCATRIAAVGTANLATLPNDPEIVVTGSKEGYGMRSCVGLFDVLSMWMPLKEVFLLPDFFASTVPLWVAYHDASDKIIVLSAARHALVFSINPWESNPVLVVHNRVQLELGAASGALFCIAVSPFDPFFACGTANGDIALFSTEALVAPPLLRGDGSADPVTVMVPLTHVIAAHAESAGVAESPSTHVLTRAFSHTHTGVTGLTFSPSGLVSCGSDGTVQCSALISAAARHEVR